MEFTLAAVRDHITEASKNTKTSDDLFSQFEVAETDEIVEEEADLLSGIANAVSEASQNVLS